MVVATRSPAWWVVSSVKVERFLSLISILSISILNFVVLKRPLFALRERTRTEYR